MNSTAGAQKDNVLETAVGQLSLVSAAMKMLLETCERELLEAADLADPGPGRVPREHMQHVPRRRRVARVRRSRLRAR